MLGEIVNIGDEMVRVEVQMARGRDGERGERR